MLYGKRNDDDVEGVRKERAKKDEDEFRWWLFR